MTGTPTRMPSVRALLLANFFVIILAVLQQWSVATILWSYWCQSVIIGLFQAKKMADLKEFSTKGMLVNDRPVDPTPETKRSMARFFLFHYNAFHVGYLIFLITGLSARPDWWGVGAAAATFFINHWFSYRENRAQDRKRVINLGLMMFYPYIRILPMHLFIIFLVPLAGSPLALAGFLLLKTGADVVMHVVEHKHFSS